LKWRQLYYNADGDIDILREFKWILMKFFKIHSLIKLNILWTYFSTWIYNIFIKEDLCSGVLILGVKSKICCLNISDFTLLQIGYHFCAFLHKVHDSVLSKKNSRGVCEFFLYGREVRGVLVFFLKKTSQLEKKIA